MKFTKVGDSRNMRTQSDALARVRFLLFVLCSGIAPGVLFGGCTSETTPSGCRTTRNCGDDAPICDSSMLTCRKCSMQNPTDEVACGNRSASTPHCGAEGLCIGCTSNSDCSASKPVCDIPSASCVGCRTATDCDSNVCDASGSCSPSSSVLYVDNKAGTCTGTHTGTSSDAFCAIQDAVNDAAQHNKSLIAVKPSTVAYGPVIISTVSTAGLRLSSTTGAPGSVQIRASNTDAISVTASGGNVLISGFDLAATGGVGVNCTNANLTVTTSSIHHNANGIVTNNCTVTLDRLRVYKSDFNGISLNSTNGSTYVLNNLMIYANYYSGLTLSGTDGTMRFLTVYSNGNPSLMQAPGISCGAMTNRIENSIVYRNVSQSNFDNQVTGCNASFVVTDDSKGDTYSATVKTTVDFNQTNTSDLGAYDLGLKNSAADLDCCIDKVNPSSNFIDHDFKGSPRPTPQGGKFDIGADEYKP